MPPLLGHFGDGRPGLWATWRWRDRGISETDSVCIAVKEYLALLATVHFLRDYLYGQRWEQWCDNTNCVHAISAGRSRSSEILLECTMVWHRLLCDLRVSPWIRTRDVRPTAVARVD